MCYQTKQSKLAKDLENRFKAKMNTPELLRPNATVNGFDFPLTPVIIDTNPELILHYNWGLIPTWAENDEIKKVTLNAKIETIDDKPSFKNSVNKRCLVIANGFYEWQWQDSKGKNKVKYEIGIGNEALFAFAGIYSQWKDSNSGEIRNTYSIVTTEANSLMAEIHNIKKRMPIILKPEDEANWLNHADFRAFAYPYEVSLQANAIDNNFNTQTSLF